MIYTPSHAPWNRLRLAAHRALRAWGWPAWLGAAWLLAAWLIDAQVLPRQAVAQAALEAQVQAQVQAARARALAAPAAAAKADADPLQQFRAAFPHPRWRQQRLAGLYEGAARAGLSAGRSEHRAGTEPALGLARYRVTLPLTGTYAQLRGFVQQALADDPALSLDSLRLVRPQPGQALLQAQLQWSLWMQAPDLRVAQGALP